MGGGVFIEVRCRETHLLFTSPLTSFLPGVAKFYSVKEETDPERASDLPSVTQLVTFQGGP